MSIIGTVANSLQTALGASIDQIGRQTGVIKRQRKFSGSTLLKTLVLTLLKAPSARPDQFVSTAAQLGVMVTSEAIEKRFTPSLILFLRASLEELLTHSITANPVAIPLLSRFTELEVADSSTVTLPDEYAAEFPGCGGKADSGKSAVKLQVRWNLLNGGLSKLVVEAGRTSDGTNEAADVPLKSGALSLRDLGYFNLKRFQRLSAKGVSWISRWQQGTLVFDQQGQELKLLEQLQKHQGTGPVELSILLGAAERVPCRLIALRVPQEMVARRRQAAYVKARKHGREPSQEHLAWCEWTILVTNCPEEMLNWKEVIVLYRVRWQIELLFKLWKSHNHLAAYRPNWSAQERMAVFWAKLIGVVLQHWLLLMSTWSEPRRSLAKAAQVIREWIPSLTQALRNGHGLIEVLTNMTAAIEGIAKQKLRRKDPSSFQLLSNPELLDWDS